MFVGVDVTDDDSERNLPLVDLELLKVLERTPSHVHGLPMSVVVLA